MGQGVNNMDGYASVIECLILYSVGMYGEVISLVPLAEAT
jgi:hypothetical protein